jgi:hypothetical protein
LAKENHDGKSKESRETGQQRAAQPQVETQQSGTALASFAEPDDGDTFGSRMATVAAIGLGVALIEVELIPGMLIGVAAMMAPKLLPRLGNGLKPLLKSAMRAGYAIADKTRETMAEAGEQFQDIVAEVKSEHHAEEHAGAHRTSQESAG